MSASVTLTIRPGSERGAEHVNRENRYPAPPPIIPAPFEYAPDGLLPPIIPDRVGLPEPQPARARPATAVVSANRVRNTTRRRIHPDATTPEPQERSGKSHASIHGKPVLRRPQTRHADPLALRAPASERSNELPPARLASRDPQRAAVLLPPGAQAHYTPSDHVITALDREGSRSRAHPFHQHLCLPALEELCPCLLSGVRAEQPVHELRDLAGASRLGHVTALDGAVAFAAWPRPSVDPRRRAGGLRDHATGLTSSDPGRSGRTGSGASPRSVPCLSAPA